jgi:chromosome condensin MukBEF complex kleisin-like MukF subunit
VQSFARQLLRSAADETAAKLPLYRDAPLPVTMTVYSSEELLFSQLAAHSGIVLIAHEMKRAIQRQTMLKIEEKS